MTREEAISLLSQVNEILVNSNSWLENTHEPLNMAFDMATKALEQTGWIPVSERLPEICQEDCHGNITFSKTVLTTQIYGDGYVHVGIDGYTTNNGGGWLTEVPFDNPEECCKVIAWMPLPEPYKTESEESK